MSVLPWFAQGHSRFIVIRTDLENRRYDSPVKQFWHEFLLFGFKQGWACLFGGLLCLLLIGTYLFYPTDAPMHRYDFLTIAAICIQILLLLFRLETLREASVILVFHIVGTLMELFKTSAGSWEYPEASLLHIGAVPLFSGFMYASVGSYIARVWRIFDFRYDRYPPRWATYLLAACIYANFFTHHFIADMRWLLFGLTGILFWRTKVYFKPAATYRWMPLWIGFALVSLFIWLAENIGTYAAVWQYPDQKAGWHMVSFAKFGSWYLLMIISFVLVSLLQPISRKECT